jgi:clan AA aspartic protease
MNATDRKRTLHEVARLGDEAYNRLIKPTFRPEDEGKSVAIDVDSDEFEIDPDDYTAIMRLRARKPDAEIYLSRVGGLSKGAGLVIIGAVNPRNEAVVPIRLRGPSHPGLDLKVVVDSGFTESLMLPMPLITTLGLARQSVIVAVLGDGSDAEFEVYTAEISWNGRWRLVTALVGSESLLGMRLLVGHELRVAVVPGGAVEISPLP